MDTISISSNKKSFFEKNDISVNPLSVITMSCGERDEKSPIPPHKRNIWETSPNQPFSPVIADMINHTSQTAISKKEPMMYGS